MSGVSVFSRVRKAAGRFAGADQGNVAMIFAIAAVPLISLVGAAVDYTRANTARTAMQAALDSTSLMLSKDLQEGLIQPSDINTKAQIYFNALFNNTDAKSVTVTAVYTASTSIGSTIVLNGAGNVTTDFMKVAGFPKLDFNTSSTSAWGNVRMRVAMALDNTGSMNDDGKMPAMQTAAKSLIDQLSALAKNPGDIYISIVPFAKDVNMGASFVNSTWIDWTDWDAKNGFSTCTAWNSKGKCTASYWTPNDHSTWTGCFTDRDQDYDTTNTPPSSSNAPTMVVAEEYTSGSTNYCRIGSSSYVQPVVPLSYNWSSLKTAIDNLDPTGNTNQGIGLAWGWLTLGTGVPFNAPAKDTGNYTYKEAIVLLSDGLNTQNRYSSTASEIDAREKILCTNAKAANITIYTVQVDTGGDGESTVLKQCASGTDKYYHITDPSQTLTVFNSIGQSLAKLHVYR